MRKWRLPVWLGTSFDSLTIPISSRPVATSEQKFITIYNKKALPSKHICSHPVCLSKALFVPDILSKLAHSKIQQPTNIEVCVNVFQKKNWFKAQRKLTVKVVRANLAGETAYIKPNVWRPQCRSQDFYKVVTSENKGEGGRRKRYRMEGI